MHVKHVEHTLFTEQMKALNKDKSMSNMLNINIYSALFTQYISYIVMLNMLNQAQKIPRVFIQSN